ncbi:MAG: HYR domain-containing protein [Candidatus Zixiibacteriota bacterium]
MRKWCLLVVAVAVLSPAGGWAENAVVVESRGIGVNGNDVPVHIRIMNDVTLSGLQIPLVIREVTPGATVTALRGVWRERLALPGGSLRDIRVTKCYADATGSCKPGGFPNGATSSDTLEHAVLTLPEGLQFAAISLNPAYNLPPGADATGSIVLFMDAGAITGTFEIDTTCVDPTNHVLFAPPSAAAFAPGFTKGTISIVANDPPVALCQDVTVPADQFCQGWASIDAGTYDPDGHPLTITVTPPGPYQLGPTLVTLHASDPYGGEDECSATITVADQTPPVLACEGDTIVIVTPPAEGAMVEFGFTAGDNCTPASVECEPPSGSFFFLGLTPVTCIATDDAGNSDTCNFNVFVGGLGLCNLTPEDVNCDGAADAVDLALLIDAVFFGAASLPPCCVVK